MVFAKPLTFTFNIGLVFRVIFSHFLPVILKVAADAVLSLQLEVDLFSFLKKSGVVPGGAV